MKYSLYIFLFFYFHGYSQFGPQRIITAEADGSRIICAADLDGDGNVDVLSANKFGNNLTWYKNMDGNGDFGPQNIIAFLTDTIHVHTSDIDGDGDMDVLAVSYFNGLVVWYENLDGAGNFSSQKIISTSMDGAYIVIAADIDGDGDMDVVSGSDNTGISWFENIDGNGSFGPLRVINAAAPIARAIHIADIDGDGDLDIVGSNSGPSVTLSWYENLDGLGNFSAPQLIDTSNFAIGPIYAIDVDGDNDMDVVAIAAVSGADKVVWYENDGMGNFGAEIIIADYPIDVWSIYSADLDNDGDNDILTTSGGAFDGEVVWIENIDGLGAFGSKNIISTEVQFARSVIAADIDNDGDLDVISSSQNDDKIAWYENFTILGVEENEITTIKVYPNPVSNFLFIHKQAHTLITNSSIYDTFGRILLTKEGEVSQIDFTHYSTGVYYLKLETNQGEQVIKVIKE
ncbi:MAG: T9SS type A sorting domain-containing protein [Aequorivita sp.]|nr:T9SS type A sorting domain-containing protein [Aequorivita sp.]